MPTMTIKKALKRTIYKSAIDGRIVSKATALANPHSTFKQVRPYRVRRPDEQ
jgi:hypothetical protein